MTSRANPDELRVLDHEQKITSLMSADCRIAAVGLLAFSVLRPQYEIAGYFGALAFAMDWAQYAAAYRLTRQTLDTDDFLYDQESWPYRARQALFYAKHVAVACGLIALLAGLFA
jgi:hypothetical protein